MRKVMKIIIVIILIIAAAAAALVIKGLIEAKKTSVKEDFINYWEDEVTCLVRTKGMSVDEAIEDISENNQIVKIVNDKARARLESYEQNPERQWEEEIFGPMFPMRTFGSLEDAELYVKNHEKPLALYYFGDEEKAKRVIKHTSSGGVVVNDTIIHIANPNLPFGGVGNSGMGRYHRKAGFLSFSNPKSVLVAKNHPLWMRMKEVPFRESKLVKWLMGGK